MNNRDKPAYPFKREGEGYYEGRVTSYEGLTKREYFAAMAMQGILSSIYTNGEGYRRQLEMWKKLYPGDISVRQAVALDALAYTDELLKQLDS